MHIAFGFEFLNGLFVCVMLTFVKTMKTVFETGALVVSYVR